MPDGQDINQALAELLRRCRNDWLFYAPRFLKIKTKAGGAFVPFEPNVVQRYIHAKVEGQLQEKGYVRALVLKARQQGCSTYIEGRFFARTTLWRGIAAFILTHEDKATQNLFGFAKGFYDNLPTSFRPRVEAKNVNELKFLDTGGGYKVATAKTAAAGRSQTAQLFHGSECAFWRNAKDHMAGIGQTVADLPGTEIILESTGNGIGGDFHQWWQNAEAGTSEYIAIFCPWFWSPEYRKDVPQGYVFSPDDRKYQELYKLTDEQLYWRRTKINGDMSGDEALFAQEYPANAVEAFMAATDSYIPGELVLKARKATDVEPSDTLIIGVDPKRFGNDRFGICWRRGRVVTKVEGSKAKITTMEAVGMLANIIDNDHPRAMFIDMVGLGVGVYDRLIELGHGGTVIGVNAGEDADEPELYFNKRAEMHARKKAWFEAGPNKIPDSDEFHADLVAAQYTYDSNQRLKIETKEHMRERGIRSPDLGDAMDLTFAYPVSPGTGGKIKKQGVPWQAR